MFNLKVIYSLYNTEEIQTLIFPFFCQLQAIHSSMF